ncbi:MAG: segregation/condensation protein A [Clostridia bacterium]|nr:segregation/condensation protein A [Clostridia bacterium]MDY6184627.1 segregation/condensation protein A [Eubacteriales bacterium]
MDTLQYHLNDFDGPLDLLLTLISKNKIDIHDIPIVTICNQYMAYIEEAQQLDMEIASDFLIMASELMLIKSKMLLPGRDEKDDPRKELVNRLELYIATKTAAEQLRPLFQKYAGRWEKEEDEILPEKEMPLGLNTALLTEAMRAMLARINALQPEPELLISPLISTPIVSVEEKIKEIVSHLETCGAATLFTLLKPSETKADLLARFMGILELIKIGRVLICQSIFDLSPAPFHEESEDIDACMRDKSDATAGLNLTLTLNPDYDPTQDKFVSEFEKDTPETFSAEQDEKEEQPDNGNEYHGNE